MEGSRTTLPELVTAIAAVGIGAVSLAVGNIIGRTAIEVPFLAAGDIFHCSCSIAPARFFTVSPTRTSSPPFWPS
jgi:Ca2+/Na+ antiporter